MIKSFLFRVLRFVGVLAVIYICMVFYLALTERRNAFPRAITHAEANQAIAGKAKNVSCTLDDGTILGGWITGSAGAPVLLYYPDAEEDAAQFLAEMGEFSQARLVSFNYRGSGENKGTPSQETFESDARQIAECAAQADPSGIAFFAGRGTGAILAAQQTSVKGQYLFLDPVFSIKDAIANKYRALYPKFLIRANVSVHKERLEEIESRAIVVYDRAQHETRTTENAAPLVKAIRIYRKGVPLQDALLPILKP